VKAECTSYPSAKRCCGRSPKSRPVEARGIVERITIEVGPLSGVEPALLAVHLRWCARQLCGRRVLLDIESTPVRIAA
jgi:Zn finger protein HypA/HybF involved in hydrogenase expression